MNAMLWLDAKRIEAAREAACEILGTCASTRDGGFLAIAYELDIEGLPCDLALEAWKVVTQKAGFEWGIVNRDWDRYYEHCAEAESLLQGGWMPGKKS